MTTMLPHTPSRALIARLRDEWSSMRARPSLVRHAREWGVAPRLTSLDDLLVCTGYRHERTGHVVPSAPAEPAPADRSGDEAMARLLIVARTDELAARVVLQRLLPGLVSVARRWPARRAGGSAEALDELVGAAWGVIREFPLDRRPHHLVANLLRDCEYRAFIRSTRRLLVHESTPPHLLDRPCVVDEHLDPAERFARTEPLHELLSIAAQARHLTTDDRVLLGLLLSGHTTIEVATELRVSERTVRSYRAAMVERLRQGVDELAA